MQVRSKRFSALSKLMLKIICGLFVSLWI
jgi:hypothetical protein